MRGSDSQISAKSPAGSLPRLGPLTALGYRRHCPPGSADPSPGAYIRESNLHLAFELLVLTAALGDKVRATAWTEIDLYDEVWTIAALCTKTNREYRVSLTGRAPENLEAAWALGHGNLLVVPMKRGKAISPLTPSKILQYHQVRGVPPGFQSSCRDWVAEKTDHPREVIEVALAHVVQNDVEAAYARSDLFERWRRLIEEWTELVSGNHRKIGWGNSLSTIVPLDRPLEL